MPRRPCLGANGQPCPQQALAPPGRARCPDCTRATDQARGSRQQRGYGADHQRRRAEAVGAEPWCHNPHCPYPDAGTTANPLSLEHLDPTDRSGPVTVLCHRCNSGRATRTPR